jgi:hypothetical protein
LAKSFFSGVVLPDADKVSAAYDKLLYHDSMTRNAFVYVDISKHLPFRRLEAKGEKNTYEILNRNPSRRNFRFRHRRS